MSTFFRSHKAALLDDGLKGGAVAQPWQGLSHPAVRDLAWAIFSEPILLSSLLEEPGLANPCFACTDERGRWLRSLDRKPAPLLAALPPQPARLGLYFEALWHFFLRSDPAVDLLGHNLAVRSGGRTLGEFDVLYACLASGRQVHLELAVKFYLGLPGTATWLGPGQRDQLHKKTEHLLQRQIRLAEAAEARSVLAAHQVLEPAELGREIEIKGYLFQPFAAGPSCRLPRGHNSRNALGRWLPLEVFSGCARGTGWVLLSRAQWLSPYQGVPGIGMTAEETLVQLREAFAAGSAPQLVVRCDAGGSEQERIFVTPSSWPDRPL